MSKSRIVITGYNVQGDVDSDNTSVGALRILVERYRVMDTLGKSVEHDLQYENGELLNAAAAYIFRTPDETGKDVPFIWPWSPETYHGGQDRIADLVRAGQFIAAEIDRLFLLAETGRNPNHPKSETDSPSRASVGFKLVNFRSDGDRLDANSDSLSPTATVFEPGAGSDPVTWFDGALVCCCATNKPGTRCYRCKEGLHDSCSNSGAYPAPVTDPARPDNPTD